MLKPYWQSSADSTDELEKGFSRMKFAPMNQSVMIAVEFKGQKYMVKTISGLKHYRVRYPNFKGFSKK